MKSKKYISSLLIGLLSLTGCVFDSTSNNSNSSSQSSSNSELSTSSTSVSDSTNDTKKENYFNQDDTKKQEDYFGFVLPSLDLEYTLEDLSDYLGYTCVVIYFDNASEEDFLTYRDLLSEEFTFIEEGEYEGDYWYMFQEGNFEIDICYDDYSEAIPFIYVQVYDISDGGDDSGEEITLKETVNGYFDSEDSALLDSYFDFTVPCVGSYYYLEDGTVESLVDIYVYYFYVTDDDFATFQSELEKFSTYEGAFPDEENGYTWHCYATDNLYIDVIYDNSVPEETYIYMNIYDQAWLEQ